MKACFLFCRFNVVAVYILVSTVRYWRDVKFVGEVKRLQTRFPLKETHKFWEELIAYFPWYDKDRIENEASNNSPVVECVFGDAVIFLPSRCLATIRDTHVDT
jgi:hypothetical protein